jgi:hypothetical protein
MVVGVRNITERSEWLNVVNIKGAPILLFVFSTVAANISVSLASSALLGEPIWAIVIYLASLIAGVARSGVVLGHPSTLAFFATKLVLICLVSFCTTALISFAALFACFARWSARWSALPMRRVFADPMLRLPSVHTVLSAEKPLTFFQAMIFALNFSRAKSTLDGYALACMLCGPYSLTRLTTKWLLRPPNLTISPDHLFVTVRTANRIPSLTTFVSACIATKAAFCCQAGYNIKKPTTYFTSHRYPRAVGRAASPITELLFVPFYETTKTVEHLAARAAHHLNLARSITIPARPATVMLFSSFCVRVLAGKLCSAVVANNLNHKPSLGVLASCRESANQKRVWVQYTTNQQSSTLSTICIVPCLYNFSNRLTHKEAINGC